MKRSAGRGAAPDWLAWAALAAALSVTASAEYGLARDCGFGEYVAAGVPAALDIYAVRAFRAHRDVPAAVGAMIVVNTLAHLVDAGKLAVSVLLVVLVSVLAPLVVWRVHRIGTAPLPQGEPAGRSDAPLPPVGLGAPGPTGPAPAPDFGGSGRADGPVRERAVPDLPAGGEAPALPAPGAGSPSGSPGPSALPGHGDRGCAPLPEEGADRSALVPDPLDTGWDSTRSRTDEELLELARRLSAAGESTSASALMRHFGIGATRAGRIRDALNPDDSGRESAA